MGREITLSAIHRIIKKAGVVRATEDAIKLLGSMLEDVGLEISKEAAKFANHAGRKTVKAIDIKLAMRKLFGK